MIKVALTGNIGSGKSIVAIIFDVFGVPIFNADIEARKLYHNTNVKNKLRMLFSDGAFNAEGEVDTNKLALIIFNNKQSLQAVNNIIHPMVLSVYNNWCLSNEDAHYTIHETAILFENKLQSNFDFVINVSAPRHIRLKRVMLRDGISQKMVEQRMSNQISDKIKCELSQFVINNDGVSFIIPQVEMIHKKLLSL